MGDIGAETDRASTRLLSIRAGHRSRASERVARGGGLALVMLLAGFAAAVLLAGEPAGAAQECPEMPRLVRPSGFHFRPGMQEHESWIEFSVPERDATAFVLCFEGKVVSANGGHTPADGPVKVNVRTRWVNREWLLGRLASDEDASRWELRYTTYRLLNRT